MKLIIPLLLAVAATAPAKVTLELTPAHIEVDSGQSCTFQARVEGTATPGPIAWTFLGRAAGRLDPAGAACRFTAPLTEKDLPVFIRAASAQDKVSAVAQVLVRGKAAPAAETKGAPFQLEDLAELRDFLLDGRESGSFFYSVGRFPTIITPRPVTAEGLFPKGPIPEDGPCWYLFDQWSPPPADRFLSVYDNFLAMLGGGVTIRAATAGAQPGFEIAPRSGRPAPSFLLACRRSPLAPGRIDGDRLETRLRRARWLVLQHHGDLHRLAEQLDRLFSSVAPREVEFVKRCLGLMGKDSPENFTLEPGVPNPSFVLNPFTDYLRKVQASGQPQGAVILVGRGMTTARSGRENLTSSEPLLDPHPAVYTIDQDPSVIPDLVADIRSLDHLASIPDHSVDQFWFDGVTYPEVYNADLVEVLAHKLKPGGAFIDTSTADRSALLGPRFEGPAPLAPGDNWLGSGAPRKYRLRP